MLTTKYDKSQECIIVRQRMVCALKGGDRQPQLFSNVILYVSQNRSRKSFTDVSFIENCKKAMVK